jgi:hypothetical protein
LNRYLRNPPVFKTFNIVDGQEFNEANTAFQSMCIKRMREQGKGKVHHKRTIQKGDMQKLYSQFSCFLTLTFVGKFTFPLNRYFSQITLTNRIYLYKMSQGNSCCSYLTINTVKPALGTTYKPILTISTGFTAQDQLNFVQTSKFFSFYLGLYKNKFKNLIRTSKFKFSVRGLLN